MGFVCILCSVFCAVKYKTLMETIKGKEKCNGGASITCSYSIEIEVVAVTSPWL